jgi:hypothetical protein
MNNRITAAVGWKCLNKARDVRVIHDLLVRVPIAKGGAHPGFDPTRPYGPHTDDLIFKFQRANNLLPADAVVDPDRPTLRRMNELAEGQPPRCHVDCIEPSPVVALMTNQIVGETYVKGYDGSRKHPSTGTHPNLARFAVPLYELRVGRSAYTADLEPSWKLQDYSRSFKVIRFGVRLLTDAVLRSTGVPRAVDIFRTAGPPTSPATGFAAKRSDFMKGSWHLSGEYFIHAGPKFPSYRGTTYSPERPSWVGLVGGLGCIQTTGDRSMQTLDDCVRELAFGASYRLGFIDAAAADRRISAARSFHCVIEPSPPPPLRSLDSLDQYTWQDYRDVFRQCK